jgi:hypothetical protein
MTEAGMKIRVMFCPQADRRCPEMGIPTQGNTCRSQIKNPGMLFAKYCDLSLSICMNHRTSMADYFSDFFSNENAITNRGARP